MPSRLPAAPHITRPPRTPQPAGTPPLRCLVLVRWWPHRHTPTHSPPTTPRQRCNITSVPSITVTVARPYRQLMRNLQRSLQQDILSPHPRLPFLLPPPQPRVTPKDTTNISPSPTLLSNTVL
ncbi:hypothetical protein E2C01_070513 [Portunus trituberculatus]|uniref:Uncharacterized protein n=1 Tax=Portunus trituberculatus TaxID=210409 RepID=A0A5B7I5G4_PORTR|nr:hypothetical protein [Portunus trituberculatus]